MATVTTVELKVEDGKVVLPNDVRRALGIADDAIIVAEVDGSGVHLGPADWFDPGPEVYTPERIAEFLLNNSMDEEGYAWARDEVQRMGMDPDQIDHFPWPP